MAEEVDLDGVRKEKERERHRLWYQSNKESWKDKKIRFNFKIELKKEEEERLQKIKTDVDTIKKSLKCFSSNADIMEKLIDCWFTSQQGTSSNYNPVTSNSGNSLQTDSFNSLGSSLHPEIPPEDLLLNKLQLHSECQENDEIYLVCGSAINRLFKYFISENGSICRCGRSMDFTSLQATRATKNNHCLKFKVDCIDGHTMEWFSSSIMSSPSAGKYYVNARMRMWIETSTPQDITKASNGLTGLPHIEY